MNNNKQFRKKDDLCVKFSIVFNKRIAGFSAELQRILIDDMITAFENRLNVLKKTQDYNDF